MRARTAAHHLRHHERLRAWNETVVRLTETRTPRPATATSRSSSNTSSGPVSVTSSVAADRRCRPARWPRDATQRPSRRQPERRATETPSVRGPDRRQQAGPHDVYRSHSCRPIGKKCTRRRRWNRLGRGARGIEDPQRRAADQLPAAGRVGRIDAGLARGDPDRSAGTRRRGVARRGAAICASTAEIREARG